MAGWSAGEAFAASRSMVPRAHQAPPLNVVPAFPTAMQGRVGDMPHWMGMRKESLESSSDSADKASHQDSQVDVRGL
jgi:hypothetical protein